MNFVSFQAQEAIINPDLPDSYKDALVGAAVGTIRKIGERRSAYDVVLGVKEELKSSSSASQKVISKRK